MTKATALARTRLCLLALALMSTAGMAYALPEPEPIAPGFLYSDNLAEDAESLMLLNRLRQLTAQKHRAAEEERQISEEQIEIQAMLEAKAREQQRASQADYLAMENGPEAEVLPAPAAMVYHGRQHSGKRTGVSYMSLCHFKICNMGRKRQS